jgi:dienelactone hydrolase
MCNQTAVELAERGGYILAAPMGYNTMGWYGSPVITFGAGAGLRSGRWRGVGARPLGQGVSALAIDPQQITKWSEADVMAVLHRMRTEFNVDPRRIYLTGHSMGGAGTFFLGSKYASIWAALAPVAPASFSMNTDRVEILRKIKDAGVPILLITGDADEAIPVSNTRMWASTIRELGITHEYIEQPGVTHAPIITTSQEAIYAFFGKHSRM